jgi:hypothetical protein
MRSTTLQIVVFLRAFYRTGTPARHSCDGQECPSYFDCGRMLRRSTTLRLILVLRAFVHLLAPLAGYRIVEGATRRGECKNQKPPSILALAAASGTYVLGNGTTECKRIERGLVAAAGRVV